MKMKLRKRRKKETGEEEEIDFGVSEETLAGYLDLKRWTVPEGHVEVENYLAVSEKDHQRTFQKG